MNLEEIKELIKTVDDSTINELSLKSGDFSIKLSKSAKVATTSIDSVAQTPVVTLPPTKIEEVVSNQSSTNESAGAEKITSPMVGTFYKAPSPDSPAYVKVGDSVKKGQTLAIIEAMKIMNELEAEFDCKIVEVLVEDGQMVEYDTPLFLVERL